MEIVGYHPDLWKEDPMIVVEVEGNQNIEENYRLAIIGLYGEYVDILKVAVLFLISCQKELRIQKVAIVLNNPENETETKSEEVELEALFTDIMSIEILKSRRIMVQRLIDEHIRQLEDHPELQQQLSKRKLSLYVKVFQYYLQH